MGATNKPATKQLTRRWSALARDYEAAVLSPFLRGVRFPLNAALRRTAIRWRRDGSLSRRIAIDLGCGTGPAFPVLACHFPLVIGIDFAPGMLVASVKRARDCRRRTVVVPNAGAVAKEIARWASTQRPPRILIARADIGSLEPLEAAADVVLAINSLVPASNQAVAPLFAMLARITRRRGTAILVFPALDGLAHLTRLHQRRRQAASDSPVQFVRWSDGLVRDGSGLIQKYYLPDEIRFLLRAHGFRIVGMKRLTYPWQLADAFGWGSFTGQPPIWDWYIEARRA